MDEKRRLRRRYLLAEVKYRPESSEKWADAVLMNINSGGIGLYSLGPVRKKQKVVVKIVYREGRKKTVSEEIPAVVKWITTVGGHTAAGLMFTDRVAAKSYPILSKCLKYARRNK